MSAPRKIWAYDDGLNSPDSRSWSATVPVGPSYHHGDVVRELERELQAALAYFDHHGITGGSVETTRAALAKIAQEG